jgi:hypothetical protein
MLWQLNLIMWLRKVKLYSLCIVGVVRITREERAYERDISISINSKSMINTTSFPRLYIPHPSSDSDF